MKNLFSSKALKCLRFVLITLFASVGAANAMAASDLQLSDYSWTPDPVANGAQAVFSVRATNNGSASVSGAKIVISVPSQFKITGSADYPSYCTLSGAIGSQTLTCNLPTLLSGAANSQIFTYNAIATAMGAASSTATISAASIIDSNPANDALTITPTVRAGADLSVTTSASAANVPAGGLLTYTLNANNAGPDSSASIIVTDNLPATSDFEYQSASGTNWNCSNSAAIVTCNYSGSALIGAYPPISITGRIIKATTGTITNNAYTQSNNSLILDANADNDAAAALVTNITAGTDLAPLISAPSSLIVGNSGNITISAKNNGPQSAPAGTQVVINIDPSLQIGTLPGGCTKSGQTVTCTAAAITSGNAQNFVIPVTAIAATSGSITQSVTLTPPSGFTDAITTNNSASAAMSVNAANADLSISKSKGPGPVNPGSDITSNISVMNNGPSIASYSPSNPIKVVDTLSANETYVSANSGWNCTYAGNAVNCATTGSGTLAVGSSLSLSIITRAIAGTDVAIANTACTDSTAGSAHTPSNNSPTGNDCATASVRATTETADLSIAKDMAAGTSAAWAKSGTIVTTSDSVFQIRLRVTNLSGDTARNVSVSDVLPDAITSGSTLTGVTIASASKGTATYNQSNGLISWSLTNLAVGDTETLIVTVDRNVESGNYTNNASVTSSDTTETNTANNSDSASFTIVPIADMTVNSKSVSPNPVQVGVAATYTVSVRNNGVNPGDNVAFEDVIDPTKFDITATPTTTKSGGSCFYVAATGVVSCSLGTFTRGETRQISIPVMVKYPFGGTTIGNFPVSNTNHATVTTTTFDSNGGSNKNAGNNFIDFTHDVSAPAFDLAVSKNETNPATDDPVRYDETLNYDIRISNFGPSRATNVIMTDVLQPPAGYNMTLSNVQVNPVSANQGLALQAAPNGGCTVAGANIVCKVDNNDASKNILQSGYQVIFRVKFTMSGATPPSAITTFADEARLTSAEQPVYNVNGTDSQAVNNSVVQTTTVLPSTDLQVVSKTRTSPATTDINNPVSYAMVFRNAGPSATTRVTITEQLPAGFVVNPNIAPTFSAAGATTISGHNCSGTNTLTCVLDGLFAINSGDTFTMNLSAIAQFPYSGAVAPTQSVNNVAISPGLDTNGDPISEDAISTNNTASAGVMVYGASIAGSVYSDNNKDNVFSAGEAISGVTLTLSGTDSWGNAITRSVTTDSAGNYSFTLLPPGTYAIVETQPSGYFDRNEVAGTSGGTVNNASYSSNAAQNQIININLAGNTNATGYLFQEYKAGGISGNVYLDLNNNGAMDSGENGIPNTQFSAAPQISLTGTDYAGNAVNLTTNVDANGYYAFSDIAPSDTTGYVVHELVQPNNTADGKDRNGVGNLNANSAGRAAPEALAASVLNPGAQLGNHDFGELPSASITGSVYFDADNNAIKGSGENAGLAGAIIRLTGTDDVGTAIDCSVTTDATGNYSFPLATSSDANCRLLRPGTYTITETPPSGVTHTGAYIGQAGGTSGSVNSANSAAVGASNIAISNIVITTGLVANNYNFGEKGQGISGSVFVDNNNNGNADTGEDGIPNVIITISGTTATGQDVCSFITCTTTTNSAGQFAWLNVPGSNAAGYTITEQAQTTLPLSLYADGIDSAGGNGSVAHGTAGNDVINNVVLNAGELLTNYRFGEVPSSLGGSIYIDTNGNGVKDSNEPAISGVTVTLSGNTANGVDICAMRAALTPAKSCIVTSDSNGAYSFDGLPSGTYTLTETQPSAYADGRESAGSAGGTINSAFGSAAANNQIANINLGTGVAATGNNFGEGAVTISGNVFIDPQKDGINAGSEKPLGGIIIRLLQNGSVVATTTTDASGNYSFGNLAAGTYTIEETQPNGYGSSSPNQVAVTLTAGAAQNINFAETLSSLAGRVFVDANDDGVFQSTETPISGVTLSLSGTDANGNAVNLTTTSAADGSYIFKDLLGGNYTIKETQPANYADGNDHVGSAGGTLANDNISNITLGGGIDATAYNFGEHGQSISGIIYDDRNHNGSHDSTDAPISGVIVELRDLNGNLIATSISDANGNYNFGEVPAGQYNIVEIQPAGYGNAQENATNIAAINVSPNQPITGINFGETSGQISGNVYNDVNGNGVRDSNEPAIKNVTINLSGTDSRGNAVSATTTTDANGQYIFANLAGGNYTLTEVQPANYSDGAETVGSVGGVLQGGDAIANINLPAATTATGYDFGDRGANGSLNGHVWIDTNHNNVRDSGELVENGWQVILTLNGKNIATTTTNTEGYYSFSDIPAGTGYNLSFQSPNGVTFGGAQTNETGAAIQNGIVSTSNPGAATITNGQITNITIAPNITVSSQSLPLDPSGVVYDSVSRVAVANATVTIIGPAGFSADNNLLGGAANQSQKTGTDGVYQFMLLPNAPAGEYRIAVTAPNGVYNPIQPSSIIPPCSGALSVGASPNPFLVSLFSGAPPLSATSDCLTSSASTVYYLIFTITPGVSANIINNNIPIDPILAGSIQVTKTTPLLNVTRGQLVPYTITARNTLNGTLIGVSVRDQMPAGFKYKTGTAKIDGVLSEPTMTGTILSWADQKFTAKQEKRIDLMLMVGSGVQEGEHTNNAFTVNDATQSVISNVAQAVVRIIPDTDFDCTDILGKVFDDKNANGIQDEGEQGLAGVRLASARGLLITTDSYGRYHVTCPMIANEDRGSNFILKVDERTLPTGYRMTTTNPDTVRLTRGKFAKLNFGAALMRVVRVEIDNRSFDENGKIAPAYLPKVKDLAAALVAQPSILRVVYNGNISEKDANHRIDELVRLIKDCWQNDKDRYHLIIERELKPTTKDNGKAGEVK